CISIKNRVLLSLDYKRETVHFLKSEDRAQDGSQFVHLFPPVKPHQFTGNGPFYTSYGGPAVTRQQGYGVNRLPCHPVSHTKYLPQRGTAQAVILFSVGKACSYSTAFRSPKHS